jgi:hypothetical protein
MVLRENSYEIDKSALVCYLLFFQGAKLPGNDIKLLMRVDASETIAWMLKPIPSWTFIKSNKIEPIRALGSFPSLSMTSANVSMDSTQNS